MEDHPKDGRRSAPFPFARFHAPFAHSRHESAENIPPADRLRRALSLFLQDHAAVKFGVAQKAAHLQKRFVKPLKMLAARAA